MKLQSVGNDGGPVGDVDTIEELSDILVPYAANTLNGCS
jgi:hypothetical protein